MKKQVLFLGIGWFALQSIWTTYNANMPLFYNQFTTNLALVGLFMTFDNIAALTLQPFWGARSDRTRSKWGRRIPFIMIGMPLAAIATFALPFFANLGLIALMLAAIVMNICMTSFRPALLSLFSDLFPRGVRTQVSGITDLMAGIGAIVALLVGGTLYDIDRSLPFMMAAAFLLIAAVALFFGIKEPNPDTLSQEGVEGDLPPTIPGAVRTLFTIPQKSPLFFMAGIFFTWTAWNGLESFWTIFATNSLGMTGGDAQNFAAILALSYLVGAVPSGFAAARFGRQRTIIGGMIALIPLYVFGAFSTSILSYAILLGLLGILWSLVLVNGVILFQEFASLRQIGLFSGIYAIGTALAQIAGPPSYGYLMSTFGPQALWFAGIGALILGVTFISQVREGQIVATREPAPTPLTSIR
jgi:maltose/moltooligosaccharide transporter